MAVGETTLRFTVQVAADQADAAVKALTVAFNQAGVAAKQSFVSISGAAGQAQRAVGGMEGAVRRFAQAQRSEARVARFYATELAEIVPVSNEVKGALTTALGAMIGGGIVGAAIAAVQLLAAAWRHSAAEADKLNKAIADQQKVLSDITDDWRDFATAQQAATLGSAQEKFLKDRAKAQRELNEAIIKETDLQYEVAEARAEIARLDPESIGDTVRGARALDRRLSAEKQLSEATTRRIGLAQQLKAIESGYEGIGLPAAQVAEAAKETARHAREAAAAYERALIALRSLRKDLPPLPLQQPGPLSVTDQNALRYGNSARELTAMIAGRGENLAMSPMINMEKVAENSGLAISKAALEAKRAWESTAQAISSAFSTAFANMILDADNAVEHAKNLMKSLFAMLLQMGLSGLFGSLFGKPPVPSPANFAVPAGAHMLSRAGPAPVSLTINAVDSRSFVQLAEDNPDAILRPLRAAMANRRF